MKLPRLDFTAHRDSKGYQIVGTKPPPQRWRSIDILNEPLGVPFGRVAKGGEWFSGHIVGLGGKPESVSLSQHPEAFKDFAAVKTSADLVKFITTYGPLFKAKRHDVIMLMDEAMRMRECMKVQKGESYLRNLDLKARLFKDRKTGELDVWMTPSSLLDALWLQLHDSLLSGSRMRTCRHCGDLFPAGGNSGRRLIAEFCSDEHRKRFNSLARSNPALKEKRK